MIGVAGRAVRRLDPDTRRLLMSQMAPLVSSALVTLITASILGPAERGRLAFTIAASTFLGTVCSLSAYVGAVNAARRGQRAVPLKLLRLLIYVLVLTEVIAVAMLALVGDFHLGLLDRPAAYAIVTSGGLSLVNLYISRVNQGLGDSAAFRNAAVLQAVLYLVGGVTVAFLLHRALAVILVWDLALFASSLFGLRPLMSSSRNDRSGTVGPALRESASAHFGIIGSQTLYRGDTILLGFLASSKQVGYYSVATPLAEMVWVASEALSLRTFARIAPTDTRSAYQAYRSAARANWQVCGAGGLIIALTVQFAIPPILPAYIASIHLVWLLTPGMVLQGQARIGLSALIGAGRRKVTLVVGGISFLSVGIYVPFVIYAGATGAALGSSCAYLLQAIVVQSLVKRSFRHHESAPR